MHEAHAKMSFGFFNIGDTGTSEKDHQEVSFVELDPRIGRF